MPASRHAFVTGAGSGIGRAVALALAGSGCHVTLAGRRPEPLRMVAEETAAAGAESFVLPGFDVTDAAGIGQGMAEAIGRLGAVAVLVNCAGEAPSAPFDKTEPSLLDRVMAVNFTGTFLVTQAALSSIRQAGDGRIVNIASTAGLTGYAYVSAYCAAKHAVIGLTRALALELARTDVTVNAVCPGFTDTPLLDGAVEVIQAKTGRSEAQARAALAKSNPQGRLVAPAEVADAVLWLASPGASAVTGQAIPVAGGEVMGR